MELVGPGNIKKKQTIDTEDLDKNGIITQGSKTFM